MTRVPFAMLVCLCLSSAQAAVYRWVAPDGSVVFSDNPPDRPHGSTIEEVHIRPPRTAPALVPLRTEKLSPPTDTPGLPGGYTAFAIIHPGDGTVVRENSGMVSVELELTPPLLRGHRVVLSMDGKVIAQGPQTTFQLLNMDRGTHTLEAAIQDDSSQPASIASPITFTLQRLSVLQQTEAAAPVPLRSSRRGFGPRGLSGPR